MNNQYLLLLLSFLLTFSSACDDDDTSDECCEALPSPKAVFEANVTTITTNDTISFNSSSTGTVDKVTWLFEGGTPETSDSPTPTIVYNEPGTYDVTLITSGEILSGEFAYDTLVKTEFITVNPKAPTACKIDTLFTGENTFFVFDYDTEGRVKTVSTYFELEEGTITQFDYNASYNVAGQLEKIEISDEDTNDAGEVYMYTYTNEGLIEKIENFNLDDLQTPTSTVTYQHINGEITALSYIFYSEGDEFTTMNFVLDANGNPTSFTRTTGDDTTTESYTYDDKVNPFNDLVWASIFSPEVPFWSPNNQVSRTDDSGDVFSAEFTYNELGYPILSVSEGDTLFVFKYICF
ncbi:MAG: PKD domain-containing protein [Bacteroidota bacterium]